ncbi:MAG: hypothetical protein KBT73_11700, partial [Marinobacter sp.]|nr:hypothetical protein [Marinobacter sp.]
KPPQTGQAQADGASLTVERRYGHSLTRIIRPLVAGTPPKPTGFSTTSAHCVNLVFLLRALAAQKMLRQGFVDGVDAPTYRHQQSPTDLKIPFSILQKNQNSLAQDSAPIRNYSLCRRQGAACRRIAAAPVVFDAPSFRGVAMSAHPPESGSTAAYQ